MASDASKSAESARVVIYTDGACSGNPGPGGWGALLRFNGVEKEISGGESETTNNRMELLAAIRGLEALKRSCDVDIFTDSQYVQKGITEWIHGWKRKGWKNVKNVDLWQELDQLTRLHRVQWHWVRGHNGDVDNERVDVLARNAVMKKEEK